MSVENGQPCILLHVQSHQLPLVARWKAPHPHAVPAASRLSALFGKPVLPRTVPAPASCRVQQADVHVWRHFSEVEWLQQRLHAVFPTVALPMLPRKVRPVLAAARCVSVCLCVECWPLLWCTIVTCVRVCVCACVAVCVTGECAAKGSRWV